MRRALLLLVVLLGGCADRMEEYVSEKGKFRVLFPETPSTARDPDLPRGVQKVSLVQRSGSYAVAWEDLERAGESEETILTRACEGASKRLKGKTISQTTIELQGKYPGRELILEWPEGNGVTHDRIYLVGDRIYSVVVSGAKWWVGTTKAKRFLESFEVLED